MKPNKLLLPFLILLIISCSTKDDDYGTAIPKEPAANFFPMNKAYEWDYKNLTFDQAEDSKEELEFLRVRDSITENESIGYAFSSNLDTKERSIATSLFTHGRLNNVEGRIFYNGELIVYAPVLDSLKIPLKNLLLINQNSEEGKELYSYKGSIKDSIAMSGIPVPMTASFELKSIAGERLKTYKVEGKEFENIVSNKLRINLSVKAEVSKNFEVEVLSEQRVLESTSFFAENTGLIANQTNIELEYEDLTEFMDAPPEKYRQIRLQFLQQHFLD